MLFLTSIIKNKTKIIEKDIFKYENKIASIEKNLHEVVAEMKKVTGDKEEVKKEDDKKEDDKKEDDKKE